MEEAVSARAGVGGSIPDTLRAAAEDLLARAQAAAANRDTALSLLAPDALMTYACEAVAESAPERLGTLR